MSFIVLPSGSPTCCLHLEHVWLPSTGGPAWQLVWAGTASWQLGGLEWVSPGCCTVSVDPASVWGERIASHGGTTGKQVPEGVLGSYLSAVQVALHNQGMT